MVKIFPNLRNVKIDIITFPENLKNTSGLSILLHGVISLSDAMSYDKMRYIMVSKKNDPLIYVRIG